MKNRESYVKTRMEEMFRIWFQRASLCSAALFAVFGFIDYLGRSDNFRLFLIIRICTIVLLLGLVFLSRKYTRRSILLHRILAYAGVIITTAAVAVMVNSPAGIFAANYSGLVIIGLCFIGFIPSGMIYSGVSAVLVLLVFLLSSLSSGGSAIDISGSIIPFALLSALFTSLIYYRFLSNNELLHELGTSYDLEEKQEQLELKVTERTDDLMQSYDILKESVNKFKSLFHHASDSIFLLDTDREMVIADANIAACNIHGYTKKELIGNPLSLLEDLPTKEKIRERRDELLGGATLTFEGQHVKKDGTLFPVEVSAHLVKISGREYILSIDRDITERKKMEEQLIFQALYDSLTGLPNRILFIDRLKTSFARKKRQPDILFALLFIDIDHFKKINDSYGHLIGDKLLVDVVERLTKSIRPGDTLSRFGGDEFLLILDDIARDEDAISIIHRIQEEMKRPFSIDHSEIYVTVSIGISFSNIEYTHPEDMLRDADNAMYHAKEQGRGCFVIFNEEMHHSSKEALKKENDLRKAVERNEFVLHYQPVVDINTLSITGFEALIRWEHPVYGLLYPESFIEIAESTGLIMPIGEWVLYEACSQIARWKKIFPGNDLVVSVNLSVKQFNSNLPGQIADIVEETGIDPENLRLEITESIMMKDIEYALDVLSKLKEMNVQIYIDDFGTGYSSLNYIHKFPVDAIKIDKSFIENIMNDEESIEVVRAVSTIARNLNLNLIAEGIETEEQLEIIRSLKCSLTQGFHFCKPLNSKKSEEYLREFDARYKK